jgi:hypothetical protein
MARGCSSVVEHKLSMCEVLGLVSSAKITRIKTPPEVDIIIFNLMMRKLSLSEINWFKFP